MALDGLMIKHLVEELQCLQNGKIGKISQVGNNDFLLVVRASGKNNKLFISLERNQYRIAITDKEYIAPQNATMFAMLLRKHFEGGSIEEIIQHDLDRIVILKALKTNEFGDRVNKYLIIELMGKNSNLIIADENFIIIDSLRKNGISEDGRTILVKALYKYPESHKVNIFNISNEEIKILYEENVNDYRDIVNLFSGFSPVVAKYIFNSIAPVATICNLKNNKIIPSISIIENKEDFLCYDIGQIKKTYNTISELLEEYFYQKTISNEVMEKSNNLKTHVNHIIKRLKTKIIKLEKELQEAYDSEKYRLYGELIINNLYKMKNEKIDKITLENYYTNEMITIQLDNKISVKENANKFFTKHQKSKTAINFINEQIEITNNELEYLELVYVQIENANVNDIEQIKNELIENHYLKKTTNKNTKNKKEKIDILTYSTSTGTKILVGKNNIQNEYITHKIANPNDMWYHVKDGPGSHVLVVNPENTEEEIRMASMLAAYYSSYQTSSSVAVNYTLARFIKKIPGKRNCFVTFSNEKTIYIDPELEVINSFKKIK